jgi:ATP-dependent helicase/nuclease subunit B
MVFDIEGDGLSLRFILGRAGTGKTYTCLEEIRNKLKRSPDGPFLIFLAPEQATFQTERALVSGLQGMIRAQALSFRRLAWHVLHEAGGIARVHISELGKQMLLRKLLITHREQLKVFHRTAVHPGFIQYLADIVREIKQYGITGSQLLPAITFLSKDKGQQLLAGKLSDLNLLCTRLEEHLGGRYIDPDDYLDLLAGRLPASGTVRGSEIWIDGFAGFTPQEYKVIEQIMQVAGKVNIALCLDSRTIGESLEENDYFYPTRETLNKLEAIAVKTGTHVEPPLTLDDCPPPRFHHVPAIAYLEENFFRPESGPARESAAGIKLVAAANRRAEVEGVAREIIHLCREKSYRWRDISVVLRQVDTYRTLISTVFDDYGIPFFIDIRREAGHHPLVELIRAALEIVTAGWNYDSVFRYLKTDLAPVEREDVDTLENYVLAHGIKGSRWTDSADWEYRRCYTLSGQEEIPGVPEVEKLALINRIRQAATRHLIEFQKKAQCSLKVRELTSALFELLINLDVPGQLEKWSEQARAGGGLETAQEHVQIWSAVVELFDQLVESLGDERIDLKDYLKIVEAGLESIRLGLIPPGLDQVLVASLDRSRNPDVRACFVLDVNDSILPARFDPKGVFTDPEREYLESVGITLAPAGRRRLFNEQFLVYIALTRCSEYLWLSYSLADEEGRALMPSPVIQRVKKIFPDLKEIYLPIYPPGNRDQDLQFIVNAQRVLAYLVSQLREFKNEGAILPLWWSVYDWLVQQPDLQDRCRRILAGLFYTNQEPPLPADLSLSLYGNPLRTSISRCERYYACPFAHFLAHGLKLKERPVYTLQRPDMGEFYHACLKLFVQSASGEEQDWSKMSREQCAQLADRAVENVAPLLRNEILLSSARYRYLATRLRKTVERAAWTLSTHARRSLFRPLAVELSFAPRGQLSALTLPLAGEWTMELSGRVDRVDIATFETNDYLRVIDYKSSPTGLNLAEIYYGLQLQLLTYLDVVLSSARRLTGRDALPAGVLYFTVADPVITAPKALTPPEAEKEIMKKLKMKGLILAEPDVVRLMDNEISGYSDLVPAGLKKDGSLYSNSSVVDLQQLTALRRYLRKSLVSAGEKILTGAVEIKPYRYRNRTACRYCSFEPVCLFDPLISGNNYRSITGLSTEEIWAKISCFA